MAFTREFIRNAAKQSGVELPKELEDAFIQEHISTRDGYTEQKVQEALANHKPQETKAEDSEEYKRLKQQFEDYKQEQQEKEIKQAKGNAVKELLTAAGLSGKGLEMAQKLYDLESLELDEGGKAKDFETLVSKAKTEYADILPKEQGGGFSYSPPAGVQGGKKADLGSLSMEEYIKERERK